MEHYSRTPLAEPTTGEADPEQRFLAGPLATL